MLSTGSLNKMAVWANGNESWVLSKTICCFNSSNLMGRLLKIFHKDLRKLIDICHPFWPLLWINHGTWQKPATLKNINKIGVVSTAVQLFFQILILMQTCADTFTRTWVESQRLHLWLQQHLLLSHLVNVSLLKIPHLIQLQLKHISTYSGLSLLLNLQLSKNRTCQTWSIPRSSSPRLIIYCRI